MGRVMPTGVFPGGGIVTTVDPNNDKGLRIFVPPRSSAVHVSVVRRCGIIRDWVSTDAVADSAFGQTNPANCLGKSEINIDGVGYQGSDFNSCRDGRSLHRGHILRILVASPAQK
jgi:hypothetical protein